MSPQTGLHMADIHHCFGISLLVLFFLNLEDKDRVQYNIIV